MSGAVSIVGFSIADFGDFLGCDFDVVDAFQRDLLKLSDGTRIIE